MTGPKRLTPQPTPKGPGPTPAPGYKLRGTPTKGGRRAKAQAATVALTRR